MGRLSIADVCQSAGITVGGFYFHFRNLEQVVDELAIEFVERLQSGILEQMSGKAEDYIPAVSLEAAAIFCKHSGVARALIQLTRTSDSHRNIWQQVYNSIRLRQQALMEQEYRRFSAIEHSIVSHAVVIALFAELTRCYIFREGPRADSPKDVAQEVGEFCLRLVGRGEGLSAVMPAPPLATIQLGEFEAPPPAGKGATTRRRIKSAFLHLLDDGNFGEIAEIGVVDICDKAEVTVGGFYFHYKRKEDLVRDVVTEYSDRFWRILNFAIDAKDSEDAVKSAACYVAECYANNRGLVRLINELAWKNRDYVFHWSNSARFWTDRLAGIIIAEQELYNTDTCRSSFRAFFYIDTLITQILADDISDLSVRVREFGDLSWLIFLFWRRALGLRAADSRPIAAGT